MGALAQDFSAVSPQSIGLVRLAAQASMHRVARHMPLAPPHHSIFPKKPANIIHSYEAEIIAGISCPPPGVTTADKQTAAR